MIKVSDRTTEEMIFSLTQLVKSIEKQPKNIAVLITEYNIQLFKILDIIGVWRVTEGQESIEINNTVNDFLNAFSYILSLLRVSSEDKRPTLIENLVKKYKEIAENIIEQNLAREEIILNICSWIGTSSELHPPEHLNTLDSFILLTLLTQSLYNLSWDDIVYFYKKSLEK